MHINKGEPWAAVIIGKHDDFTLKNLMSTIQSSVCLFNGWKLDQKSTDYFEQSLLTLFKNAKPQSKWKFW
jgi:hypothetical protein